MERTLEELVKTAKILLMDKGFSRDEVASWLFRILGKHGVSRIRTGGACLMFQKKEPESDVRDYLKNGFQDQAKKFEATGALQRSLFNDNALP